MVNVLVIIVWRHCSNGPDLLWLCRHSQSGFGPLGSPVFWTAQPVIPLMILQILQKRIATCSNQSLVCKYLHTIQSNVYRLLKGYIPFWPSCLVPCKWKVCAAVLHLVLAHTQHSIYSWSRFCNWLGQLLIWCCRSSACVWGWWFSKWASQLKTTCLWRIYLDVFNLSAILPICSVAS